ncbi:hypothetical protein BU23DRAFT_573181 [Bimuria novae-zelandiae CBS 107.79]|uniref:Uncharacterized protein n=1 Tax=Bimuria novae-zelandiae CBS 107.79 TaxID=1447943 RepID=A0A6A5UX27_9PLEO|nr:hypothetical protein BU23DRAFT_573181 [Bimuria novae-zelandiae CBS 107.79]
MDHWGDPWADDADANTNAANLTAPPKVAQSGRESRSPGLKPAPIVLNGFLDDAGWGSNAWARTPSPGREEDGMDWAAGGSGVRHTRGWGTHGAQEEEEIKQGRNDEDGFSAWTSAPPQADEEGHNSADADVNGLALAPGWDVPSTPAEEEQREIHAVDTGNEWSRIEEEVEESKGVENGVSEASDSATTIQADDAPARSEEELAASIHREDDTSTRSSESPSEGSHNEAATESPRTSVEEERTAGKSVEAAHDGAEKASVIGQPEEHSEGDKQEMEDEFGDFEDEIVQEEVATQLDLEPPQRQQDATSKGTENDAASNLQDAAPAASANLPSGSIGSFVLDSKLMAELFPPTKDIPELEDPPDDPISSTSTRKAWYRLTRKQTMREYNYGAVDDNYIRVTWNTSHIRQEASNTVARWVNEDRIAGRGPGARASFFWDSTAPPDMKAHEALHARQKSSVSASKTVRPVSQIVPPLSTNTPAAFNWSSPSTVAAPDGLGVRATSSPITAKHSAVTKLQRQSGRAASLDLSPRPKEPAPHKRTSTATHFPNVMPPPASSLQAAFIQASPSADLDPWASATTPSPIAPIPAPNSEQSDPWAALGVLDTGHPPKQDNTPLDDEDDDWGEMVESPAVSAIQTPVSTVHPPIGGIPEPIARSNTASTTSKTSVSGRSSPFQPPPPTIGPVHPSPIVRLKSTISPTSAVFKPNALVPTDSEQRIGPHLLKPTNRSREATPERTKTLPVQMPTMDEVLGAAPTPEAPKEEQEEDGSSSVPTTPITALPPQSAEPRNESLSTSQTPPPGPAPSSSPLPFPSLDEPNWADTADFSIFESALPPSNAVPPPAAHPDPADPGALFDSPVPSDQEPPAPFARPAPRPLTPAATQLLTGATSSAQRRKAEEDDMVAQIVGGLPDLSYMLRW